MGAPRCYWGMHRGACHSILGGLFQVKPHPGTTTLQSLKQRYGFTVACVRANPNSLTSYWARIPEHWQKVRRTRAHRSPATSWAYF